MASGEGHGEQLPDAEPGRDHPLGVVELYKHFSADRT